MKKTLLIYHLNFFQKAAKKCGGNVDTVVVNGTPKLEIEAMATVAPSAQGKHAKKRIYNKDKYRSPHRFLHRFGGCIHNIITIQTSTVISIPPYRKAVLVFI